MVIISNIVKISLVLLCLFFASCAVHQAVLPIKDKPSLDALNLSGVVVGDPINSPRRYYPAQEYRSKQAGWALVKLDVDENGNTSNLELIDWSPTKAFGEGALQYLDEAIFSPVIINGEKTKIADHYFIVNYAVDI